MILLSAIKMAWESITSNKMRSFLTMLGIIIGVGAVIILVSLVQGMSASITDTFNSFGTTRINVSAMNSYATRSFDYNDLEELMWDNSEYITGFVPSVAANGTLRVAGNNGSTSVVGANEYYAELNDMDTQLGRFINKVDVDNHSKVAVIGEYDAIQYFGSVKDSIGKIIKINGQPFRVVGVAERQSDDVTQYGADDIAYIPYTTAVNIFSIGKINQFTLIAKDSDSVEKVMSIAKAFMYKIYEDEDSYNVSSLKDMLEEFDKVTGIMSGVLGGIAGISLLVAGIGIMNIMLVSVTERTREIGIRKSIGAKRSSILLQFIIEATTLSLCGGIIGIVIGIIIATIAGNLIGFSAKPTLQIILVALIFSSAVGLFFGFNPARKASKLNPIDALRSE